MIARFEERVRGAVKAYERLLDQVPRRNRDALFTVCVDDREINSLLHEELRLTLQRLAASFGFAAGDRRRARRSARRSRRHTAHSSNES